MNGEAMRLKSAIRVCIALFAVIAGGTSCGPPASPPALPAPAVLNWDFSQNNLVSNIPQKIGFIGDTGVIEGGGRLNLKCPNGMQGSFDYRFIYIGFAPNNPKRVQSIHVYMEREPRAAAAATALKLAKHWDMTNIQPLENFRMKRTFEYGADDVWFDTIPRGPDHKYLNQPCPFYMEIKAFGGPPQFVYQPTFVAVLDGPFASTQPRAQPTSVPTP